KAPPRTSRARTKSAVTNVSADLVKPGRINRASVIEDHARRFRPVPSMKRGLFAVAAAAIATIAAPSRASLTASETEQVRRGVATATDLGRVRALVARPDLSADEAAGAIAAPATMTPLDRAHASFFHELVFGESSAPSRPVLAAAAVRAVLARADAVLGQHGLDLD